MPLRCVSTLSRKGAIEMMKFDKCYVVQVNDAPAIYQSNYFPRSFRYKQDAIACAKIAVQNGATMARVECPNGGELDFKPVKK